MATNDVCKFVAGGDECFFAAEIGFIVTYDGLKYRDTVSSAINPLAAGRK